MNKENVEKIKQIELDIFKAFVDVCDKLGLEYFVVDGTCLGAVRHHGFIPWDDDIDVGMLRKDYEIFLEKGQELLPEGLFLQTRKTDPEYPMNYAKIRNCNTTFLESSVRNCKMNHGVYIDVFPLDYYPQKKCTQKVLEFKKFWLRMCIRNVFEIDEKTIKEKIVKIPMWLAKVRYGSIKNALEKQDALHQSTAKSDLIANQGGAWGKKEIVPAEAFAYSVKVPFEGIEVKVPCGYDQYLTHVYGDYMQFPPVEERVTHHFTDVIDLERPYTDYID